MKLRRWVVVLRWRSPAGIVINRVVSPRMSKTLARCVAARAPIIISNVEHVVLRDTPDLRTSKTVEQELEERIALQRATAQRRCS